MSKFCPYIDHGCRCGYQGGPYWLDYCPIPINEYCPMGCNNPEIDEDEEESE